jgi:hypothetical protein
MQMKHVDKRLLTVVAIWWVGAGPCGSRWGQLTLEFQSVCAVLSYVLSEIVKVKMLTFQ